MKYTDQSSDGQLAAVCSRDSPQHTQYFEMFYTGYGNFYSVTKLDER